MAGRFIYVPCMQCNREMLEKGETPISPLYKLIYNTSELISFVCKNGHKNIINTCELPFEDLLYFAFENFNSKQYRESIFNFASAQERFFEFILKVICLENGTSPEKYDDLWKMLKNQSERQLGAFLASYFQRFGEFPFEKKFFEDMVTLRNSVIHKGKIPSKEEAKNYGTFVINTIHNILKKVLENIKEESIWNIKMGFMIDASKIRGKIPSNIIATSLGTSLVSWRVATDEEMELERALGEYSRNHEHEYAQKANEANQAGKVLGLDADGKLILVEAPQSNPREGATYRGAKTFEQYLTDVRMPEFAAQHFTVIDKTIDQ